MQKKSMVSRLRKQAGFTLVELSMVLVIGGLLIAATIKGQQMIEVSKSQKLVADIKHLEGMANQFKAAKKRFPGDCNADGIIDLSAADLITGPTKAASRAAEFNNTSAVPTISAASAVTTIDHGCAEMTGTAVSNATFAVNTWLNDLKIAGLVLDSTTNRVAAQQVTSDYIYLANVIDKSSSYGNGGQFNAIIVPNVPQWMARAVAGAINGNDGEANRGRVRAIKSVDANTDVAYLPVWGASATTSSAVEEISDRNATVTLAYFFENVPASK